MGKFAFRMQMAYCYEAGEAALCPSVLGARRALCICRDRAGGEEIARDAHMHVHMCSVSLSPGCLHPKQ